MKKEFPVLYAKTSTLIASPIIYGTLIIYVVNSASKQASEVYPLILTAFGISAALSGICFRMAPSLEVDSVAKYAGEKFLHSSLLLIQTLFVVYAKESILAILGPETAKKVVTAIAQIIVLYLSSSAVFTWHYGFAELNAELWRVWKRRIDDVNTKEEPAQDKKASQKKKK